MGINIWQGIYSAIQNGYFNNIQIRNNTIIGKQVANGAQVSFSYSTFLGQPAANVLFANISIDRNIVTANADSLNNGNMISIPLDPQPGLTTGNNLFNRNPGFGYNSSSDQILATLPEYIDPNTDVVTALTPNTSNNPDFIESATNSAGIAVDYSGFARGISTTNVGALELNEDLGVDEYDEEFFTIFPNPSNGVLNVNCEKCQLIVNDVNGKSIGIYNKDELNTLNLKPGVYYIREMDHDELVKVIVIQ